MTRRGRRLAVVGVALAATLVTTACQGSGRSGAFPHLGPAPVTTTLPTTIPVTTTVPVTPAPVPAAQGWSDAAPVAQAESLSSVSCTSASFCMAVDQVIDSYWVFDGHGWSGPRKISPQGLVVYAGAVSCASPHFCVVFGSRVLVYRSGVWTDIGSADEPTGLSCPTPTFCAAVDINGGEVTFDGTSLSDAAPLDSGVGLNGISCLASGFCMAVDQTGQAVEVDKHGPASPVGIDPHTVLNAVSCASESFCVAVDQAGQALRFDGSSWSRPVDIDRATPLMSVSCPQVGWCMAVDQAGQQLRFDGSSWGSPESIDGSPLVAVSCPSKAFCIAIDDHSAAAVYRSSAAAFLTAHR